jgi:hypothetical protein
MPMNIEYRPEAKRAVDTDSEMAVDFAGFGPYARERDLFFVLHWKAKAIPLKGSYDVDEARIRKENPGLGPGEMYQAILKAGVINAYVHCNDKAARRPWFLSDADGKVLVRLTQKLVKEAMPDRKIVNVRLWAKGFLFSSGQWYVQGDPEPNEAAPDPDGDGPDERGSPLR